jgi:hypothetical protein
MREPDKRSSNTVFIGAYSPLQNAPLIVNVRILSPSLRHIDKMGQMSRHVDAQDYTKGDSIWPREVWLVDGVTDE